MVDYMKADHELKVWPDWYGPLEKGIKTFDIRRNDDRNFHVGEVVKFNEFNDRTGKFTGRSCYKRISYILVGISAGAIPPLQGLQRNYSILALVSVGLGQ
jgi:hypothetical protein